jgi:N-6 DNA Methylase
MNTIETTTRADRPLEERLRAFGCTDVIRLDQVPNAPDQLEYLDLLPRRGSGSAPVVNAVAEHQGTALLYIVDAAGETSRYTAKLAVLQRQLANRSDPAWLGIVGPGSLDIHPIGFHETGVTHPVQTIKEQDPTAPLFFQNLVHGTFAENKRLRGSDYVFEEIFNLLTRTTNEFVSSECKDQLAPLDVLSMAGRALFFRFLIDRRIVREDELRAICPAANDLKDTFSTSVKAAQTSAWLDQTFNGDFLQLIDESIPSENRDAREREYLAFYQRTQRLVGKHFFNHLEAILRGWKAGTDAVQLTLDWSDLDFAHIPVGVLSQVYESFSHRALPRTAKQTSVYYTPRSIAGLMVEQSFAALNNKSSAHVLDSSCGAGIFLVLAFRRLVRERWQQDGERPKTSVIHDILYKQLRGFDVNESALRLAALALYITAIEVNASPHPPDKLKFPKNLRGAVLHRVGHDQVSDEGKTTAFSLGSLGHDVSPDFNKSFDIVIGNPPWTRLREDDPEVAEYDKGGDVMPGKSATDELNERFTAIGRRVLATRGFDDLAKNYENPDKNPDLPFLWRATEWAKEGGVIALAMPARLFGRTSGKGFEAWRAVLRSVEITGLINGADLRWSSVWKDVKYPFCVIFARNAVPSCNHRVYYAAPIHEPDLNGLGRFRIDYETTQPVSVERIEKQPWVLKTLSLGTWLDVEVMETLTDPSLQKFTDFWDAWDANGDRTGQGFNRSPDRSQKFVDFLGDLLVFEPPEDGFSIDFNSLKTYAERYGTNKDGESSAHAPRRETLFGSPLVILRKAPGDTPFSPKAYISSQALAFSQSYYGYSCAGHPEAETLAAFIYLLAHSTVFRYFALMVSVSHGADRMIFTKQDFDALPFPDLGRLNSADKATICTLARQLERDASKPWKEIDALLFRIYGLDEDAVQVAQDTLFAAASYRKAGRAALDRTVDSTRADFIAQMSESLEPYFNVCGEHVAVREAAFQPPMWEEPWFFLAVSREADTVPVNASLLHKAMTLANERGTSRIIVNAPRRRGLLLGLLNQRRWWTKTRACLCSQHIIRQHLGSLGLPENE